MRGLILGCANHCWMSKALLSPELRVWLCCAKFMLGYWSLCSPWGLTGDGDMAAVVEALGITWECFCDIGEQVWGHESSKPVNLFLRIAS